MIYGLYALVVVKNICLRDKSRNYAAHVKNGNRCFGPDV